MKNKSTSQSVLIGLFVVLMLAASNSTVRAQCIDPTWNRATGDWDNPINWSPTCRPDTSSDASINNGGTATISGLPNRYAYSLKIGDGPGDAGSLTINNPVQTPNADLIVGGGDFIIGNHGKGILSIVHNYNFTTIYSQSVYIGAQPGSSGTVNVSGSGAGFVWQLRTGSTTLFIGCTADSDSGGTAVLNFQPPFAFPTISINNTSPTIPGIKVGTSGTVTGSGGFSMTGYNDVSRTAQVFGTLAPTGGLTFEGNLDLTAGGASVVCHVTPQTHDEVDVAYSPGGLSGRVFLGGRLSVTMTGSTFAPGMRFHLLRAAAGRGVTQFMSQSITHGINTVCILPTIQYDDVANNVDLYLCDCSGCPD